MEIGCGFREEIKEVEDRPRPPPEPWEMEKVDEKRARHEDRTAWLERAGTSTSRNGDERS